MVRTSGNTLEGLRRRAATYAAKKCGAEAAAARARAGDHALLLEAARKYTRAANVLKAATPETKGDKHIWLRVAACRWHAALASVEDVGDAAAVARAHALGKASTAVADAVRVVFAAESVADELAARQQLKVAEDAFLDLHSPTEARRPRPTSRRVAFQQRVVASQAARRASQARANARRATRSAEVSPASHFSHRSPSSNNSSRRRRRSRRSSSAPLARSRTRRVTSARRAIIGSSPSTSQISRW